MRKKIVEKTKEVIKPFLVICGSILALVIGVVAADEKEGATAVAGFCLIGVGLIGVFISIVKYRKNEDK